MNSIEKQPPHPLRRIAKYTLTKASSLFATVLISVSLTILIVNLGGYLDTIQKAAINEQVGYRLMDGWLKEKTETERRSIVNQTVKDMEEAAGLNQPFAQRCLRWFYNSITFQWGQARISYLVLKGAQSQDLYSSDIRFLILSYLPRTLLLLGSANLMLFLVSIGLALSLARKPGSWGERILVALAPLSSAPAWVFGILLYAIVARVMGDFSFDLGFNRWPTSLDIRYIPLILKGLCLPFIALFLSKFFQSVYTWRTYFLIYSQEDYVDLAKAKGLSSRELERRYILRPALPGILTSFALILISIWQDSIAVEYFFKINGIGWFFGQALARNDIAVIVALVVTFAYLLSITIFLLDILYAIVDPRVKIEHESQAETPLQIKSKAPFSLRCWWNNRTAARAAPAHPRFRRGVKPALPRDHVSLGDQITALKTALADLGRFFLRLVHYPSGIIGLTLILFFLGVSLYTVIAIPYDRVVGLWRGDDKAWYHNPVEAPPAWTNWFRKDKQPVNMVFDTTKKPDLKSVSTPADGARTVTLLFPVEYRYTTSPQDMVIFFHTRYDVKKPFVSLSWVTPDGREIPIKNFSIERDLSYSFSKDDVLQKKLKNQPPIQALFTAPKAKDAKILQGRYQLKISGFLFEKDADLDAEFILYGKVFGLAGTDLSRRDLGLPLLWGTAVALSFGILAAIGTMFSSIAIAAVGAWFGGWVDEVIQRITEINMVLPVLPTSLMIFILYSKSFWVILGVTIALSIFGNSIKNYRAMFLQLKQSAYIEAARAYGASPGRIIFQYLIPHVWTVLIPQLVILVPSYVFYEATLAFLGVSDPQLPTLGKLLLTSLNKSILINPVHLVIGPLGILMLIGFGFSLMGFALERLNSEKENI